MASVSMESTIPTVVRIAIDDAMNQADEHHLLDAVARPETGSDKLAGSTNRADHGNRHHDDDVMARAVAEMRLSTISVRAPVSM